MFLKPNLIPSNQYFKQNTSMNSLIFFEFEKKKKERKFKIYTRKEKRKKEQIFFSCVLEKKFNLK